MNKNASLSYIGKWQATDVANGGAVSFYAPIQLGANKTSGIVLGGWSYTGWDNTTFHPINIALLDQNPDGTLSLNTSKYISDPSTNGQGSVIVTDFNGDGRQDIFLAAHNESPLINTASTAYLSQSDGVFKKIVLPDSLMAHSAILSTFNGVKTVVTSGYGGTDSFYQYNAATGSFTVNKWGNTYSGSIYGSSALTGDFNGDGKSELVINDFKTGPGVPAKTPFITKLAIYQLNGTSLEGSPALIAPLYFDGKAQYQNQGFTSLNGGLSHGYRVWTDDFNHDGRSDILAGVGIWSASAGWQKNKLQMFQNNGLLQFSDVTDQLGQAYDENTSFVDYSMQMMDLDHSGINSYLMAGDLNATGSKQSNYFMVNDGTGKLYAALHDQFQQWSGGMAYSFIPYQLVDGAINYLAKTSNGALYNFPIHYNITTDFTQNITITDRNQSMLMRTWAGNDTFYDTNANSAAANVDGGLGVDTSIYSGAYAQYKVSALANKASEVKLTVTNSVAPKVVDTLTNVERLQFTDTMLALDTGKDQTAGSGYMLYKAAFNRTPDAGGLGFWINKMDGGMSYSTVAQNFVNSAEFKTAFGGSNPTVNTLVTKLYNNVLNRAPDAGGLAFWQEKLTTGWSTADVLGYFSTSAENVTNVTPLIASGIQYQQFVG